MARYHLYYMRSSELLGSDAIEAADDLDAVRIAKRRGYGTIVEVWNGHSRVCMVAPNKALAISE